MQIKKMGLYRTHNDHNISLPRPHLAARRRRTIKSIASIPLSTFTPNGYATAIHFFAQWGLIQLLFGLLYLIVLWRYQSLIPLMYLFIFLEYTGRLLVGMAKPLETAHTPPGAIANYIFIPLALIMLVLSLRNED